MNDKVYLLMGGIPWGEEAVFAVYRDQEEAEREAKRRNKLSHDEKHSEFGDVAYSFYIEEHEVV